MGKIHDAIEKSQQSPAASTKKSSKRFDLKSVERLVGKQSNSSDHQSFNLVDARLDRHLISYFKPESIEAEQFRKLAANILFHNTNDETRCFLITSAKEGEGKSFCTANLAISLAKSLEEPVLLIDCDLRRPMQHKLFGLGATAGLSDHFTKEMEIASLIQKTPIDHLELLPAGNKSFHSAELLSSKRMATILTTLKDTHRQKIILIDSPPPLSTAEPAAIARQADGILLILKCEKTPRDMVEDLIKTVGKEKIIGVVMNHFNIRFQKYYRHKIYQ